MWETGIRPTIQTAKTIKADVVFGVPSARCKGTGICKVIPMASFGQAALSNSPCHHAPGIFSYSVDTGLRLSLVNKYICQKLWKAHFREGSFFVIETICLPPLVVKQLGLSNPFIQSGKYAIEKSDDYLTIRFS